MNFRINSLDELAKEYLIKSNKDKVEENKTKTVGVTDIMNFLSTYDYRQISPDVLINVMLNYQYLLKIIEDAEGVFKLETRTNKKVETINIDNFLTYIELLLYINPYLFSPFARWINSVGIIDDFYFVTDADSFYRFCDIANLNLKKKQI